VRGAWRSREAELARKTVIVTGASRGIGAATAVACAQSGAARVMMLARSAGDLATTAKAVAAAGSEPMPRVCDVTDRVALAQAVEELADVDVLVNCAGANQPEPFAEVDEVTFDRLWQLNVGATFFASQAVVRRMLADERGGVIVNISSQMGHVGAANRTVYCATKHAVEGLTKALAVELAAHGIRVVSIAPTFVRTAMTEAQLHNPSTRSDFLQSIPMGRFANPEEVADAVVFAASERAALFTGSSLRLDGGWTAK
jgi:NAD(P)-dependent dehydrogenase (short-subunit alcohol dehydrogenase family)